MASRDDNVMSNALGAMEGKRVKLHLRNGETYVGAVSVHGEVVEVTAANNVTTMVRLAAVDAFTPQSGPAAPRAV